MNLMKGTSNIATRSIAMLHRKRQQEKACRTSSFAVRMGMGIIRCASASIYDRIARGFDLSLPILPALGLLVAA
jgi:hypothetical protein